MFLIWFETQEGSSNDSDKWIPPRISDDYGSRRRRRFAWVRRAGELRASVRPYQFGPHRRPSSLPDTGARWWHGPRPDACLVPRRDGQPANPHGLAVASL